MPLCRLKLNRADMKGRFAVRALGYLSVFAQVFGYLCMIGVAAGLSFATRDSKPIAAALNL